MRQATRARATGRYPAELVRAAPLMGLIALLLALALVVVLVIL
jgi:hypothetical protein